MTRLRPRRDRNAARSIRFIAAAEPLEGRALFSTYTVTTLGDGAGIVSTSGINFNATTLRAALNHSNTHAGADTIKFASGLTGTINLGTALPRVKDVLTIAGPGASSLTVQRGTTVTAKFTVLRVDAGKSATVSGLKISRSSGDLLGPFTPNRAGGGVVNFGTLKLVKCTVSGNAVAGANASGSADGGDCRGGGIFNAAGASLTLVDCTVSGNTATGGRGGDYQPPYSSATESGDGIGGGVYNAGTLAARGTTISGNRALAGPSGVSGPPVGGDAMGGGVFDHGTLVMTRCTVSGNTGDGVYQYAGPVTLVGCTITGTTDGIGVNARGFGSGSDVSISNSTLSNNDGGGIAGSGARVRLDNSTLSGNTNMNGGGGVFNDEGTFLLTSCTLSGNRSGDSGGGGVLTNSFGSTLATTTLYNCTFSGNTSTRGGGAVCNFGTGVRTTLTNCTVSGNRAVTTGGGLLVRTPDSMPTPIGTLTLHNTIVVGNVRGTTSTGPADDVVGPATAASANNVIGPGGAGGLANGVNGNKVGVTLAALKLGPLQANGGPTKTMALLAGSPAIDAGNDARALAANLYADQRGVRRFRGTHVDAGAYEVQPAGGGSIAGTFFNDADKDGVKDSGEAALANWQAYVDRDDDGVYDPGEVTAFSDGAGAYKFVGLAAGTYRVREVRLDGWVRTKPSGAYPLGYYDVTINLSVGGGAVTGKDFGNYFA